MAEVEIKQENLVYAKPKLITDNVMHYCPGCSHGTVHKLIAEVIEEMGLEDRTVGISPVGCSVFAYNYIRHRLDRGGARTRPGHRFGGETPLAGEHGLHVPGRTATCRPSVRRSRSMRAARGENVVAIYINNAIYGMTGGQMAPTTLLGMKTSTTPPTAATRG